MNIVIFGASSGSGDSISRSLPNAGDNLWLVNRSRPSSIDIEDGASRQWVNIDIADPESIQKMAKEIDTNTIDLMIYCIGIWESSVNPSDVSPEEIYQIMSVNTSGFIATTVALFEKLNAAESAKVIGIGSIVGLDNAAGTNLAYAASKLGMRGAVHGMREWFKNSNIGATCISPGSMSTEESNSNKLPHSDIIKLIGALTSMSALGVTKEIIIPAIADKKV